jgi:DNA (cytosine-5)-methyltransferase 1
MIRVFEAFAGIGTQRMALRNLGVSHEVVAISEIDKFAIKSYEAIHGETLNLGDISKIDVNDVPEHDLFTYSFPCQDISIAGKQASLEKGSGTRSSLLWECERIIKAKRPKYLLMENVKNLVGKKHKEHFEMWLETLVEYGYTNYWKVLNAKDYGIPQNRERVFVVSILGEHKPYKFPKPFPLELGLKDILEDEADEKFYLSKEKVDKLIINSDTSAIGYIPRTQGTQHQSNTVYKTDTESPSIQARDYKDPVKVLIDNEMLNGGEKDNHVLEGVDVHPFSKKREFRGYRQKEISPCLLAADCKAPKTILESQKNNLRIRKLTPKECWRLMGCTDEDFHKAEQVNSNSQLYKQAGNAIVVDVLEHIFENLFI